MIKTLKLVFGLIVIVGVGLAAWYFSFGTEAIEKARFVEVQTTLAALTSAEEFYHKEYGKFSADYREIGYSPEGKLRGKFYLTVEALPEQLKHGLQSSDLPYVSSDDYQIVIAYEPLLGKTQYFKKRRGLPLETVQLYNGMKHE